MRRSRRSTGEARPTTKIERRRTWARPKPRKRFGQHFLEPAWVAKVIDVIEPRAEDTFLEIGPGRGALTRPLAARAGRVIAVEIDRDLVAELQSNKPPNVHIVAADVLGIDLLRMLREHGPDPARVAGNLPYNVASPILFRLLRAAETGAIADATVMLQKEVADRLVATPGSREYGVLAVLAGLRADIRRLLVLPPGAFRPAPRVTSAVVRLSFRPPPFAVSRLELLERLVRVVFTRRRKTILNALGPFAATESVSAAQALARAGLDPKRRPETLKLTELVALAEVFASTAHPAML